MTTFKKGDIVLYSPSTMSIQQKFGGVVRDDPWYIRHGEWIVHIIGLGPLYREVAGRAFQRNAYNVNIAAIEHAPVLYRKGYGWSVNTLDWPEGALSDGLIQYVGDQWIATANDRHHAVESYEAARAKIEEICR